MQVPPSAPVPSREEFRGYIDISRQISKGLEAIDISSVDTVITLCAEEVCPIFPGKVLVNRWGIDDPVEAQGTQEERLRAFRTVRGNWCGGCSFCFMVAEPHSLIGIEISELQVPNNL